MIKTKIGQAPHMGKHEAACQMERLVRELYGKLEDAGLVNDDDKTAVDNVVYTFLATLPAKVRDEVRHG